MNTHAPSLHRRLMRQLEQQEGRINHMYRDTRGFITIGVGHMMPHADAASGLPFIHRDSGRPARPSEIQTEFIHLQTLPFGQQHGAASYRRHTRLILPEPLIDALTRQHIKAFSQELGNLYGHDELAAMPEPVQLALYDMIFNLGLPKLKHGFPRFNQHIRNGNWAAAAHESHRQGISEARNRHVQELLSGKVHQQVTTQAAT